MRAMLAEDRVLYLETILQRRNAEFIELKKLYNDLLNKNNSLKEELKQLKEVSAKQVEIKEKPKKKSKLKNAKPSNNN